MVLDSLSPLSIGNTDMQPPANPFDYFYNVTYPTPYQNLGIPGADTNDLIYRTGDINNLVAGNADNAMFDLILRTPDVEGTPLTAMVAAIAQQPTFVTVWIGNNDVLGAVLAATPMEGVTMTPVDAFAADYATLIGGLATSLPGAQKSVRRPAFTMRPR